MTALENAIVELFKGLGIGARILSDETKLSYEVCYEILRAPNRRVNEETASIIHEWVEKQFGYINRKELFHPHNVSNRGRRPYTGTCIDRSTRCRMVICSYCHLEVPARKICIECDKVLIPI